MLVQAGALALLVAGHGGFGASLATALMLGAGTAKVYPTLLAAVSDATEPTERARLVRVYRFWRDTGFVLGALVAGIAADVSSADTQSSSSRPSPPRAASSSPPPHGNARQRWHLSTSAKKRRHPGRHCFVPERENAMRT